MSEPSGSSRVLECGFYSCKSHWTETFYTTSESGNGGELGDEERLRNKDAFEELKKDSEWGAFFKREQYDVKMGQKIAEGGQAEVYEALGTNKREYCMGPRVEVKTRLVLKVFKKGFCVQNLRQSWPSGLAAAAIPYRYFPRPSSDHRASGGGIPRSGLCFPVGAELLEDGRFAFIYDWFWGDLRKLINKRMSVCTGSRPFNSVETCSILTNIASGMAMLHKLDVRHNDLKASNVLVMWDNPAASGECPAFIADFDSSVGIAGTGFWRAPEVLRVLKYEGSDVLSTTKESDVYSFAMTCYEVLTGREPFKAHPTAVDVIVRGDRPELPNDIDTAFTDLVTQCWHQDPLERPSFDEIVKILKSMKWSLH